MVSVSGKKTGGRVRGTPNRVTLEFKESLNNLLKWCAPQMIEWLEEIDDPVKRFDVISKFAEFAHPKLARTEVAGDPNKPLSIEQITRVVVDPKASDEHD